MNHKVLKGNTRPPILPLHDGPCQMSPFSDDRWEIDQQEIMKRREIHRNLIFNNLKQFQNPPFVQEIISRTEEPKAPPELVSVKKDKPQELEPVPEYKIDLTEKEVFKFEPPSHSKPKSLSDIPFESPRPPNLFPLLKFPDKRVGPEVLYRPSSNYLSPILGNIPEKQEGRPKTPQFSEFKDIKFDTAIHYGVSVPFWQFK